MPAQLFEAALAGIYIMIHYQAILLVFTNTAFIVAQELKQLAAELMPIFESRDVHREAIAALLMFQHAAEEERLTAQIAENLAASLKRERRIPVKAAR